MLFNTLTYLLFLPIVFFAFWAGRTQRWQNITIVVASIVFYGWWDTRYLLLMLATCVINFVLLQGLSSPRPSQRQRKALLVAGLGVNFGVLGVFKYFNFFAESLASILSWGGLTTDIVTLNVILPVGISFYTFQLSAFLVDCYRERLPRDRQPSLLTFLGFIMFFPQLVAGPIERGRNLLGQFQRKRTFDYVEAREGMRLILWGLMKKMLLADNCAAVVNLIFEGHATATCLDLWIGALAFTFQIYGDFSGYSDMAIGSARLFDIRLSRNFDKPYFSHSIPDFWRRWHMTLMSWFKDYVYIPLGGSRCSALRHEMNVLAVFSLSGLWHGGNWTFVLWGVYHALWFRVPHRWLTFPIVVVGWVIFRSPDVATAFSYIVGMFDPSRWGMTTFSRMPLAFIVPFVLTEWLMVRHERRNAGCPDCSLRLEHPFAFSDGGMWGQQWVRMVVYLACFCATLLLGGQQVDFIYFQF